MSEADEARRQAALESYRARSQATPATGSAPPRDDTQAPSNPRPSLRAAAPKTTPWGIIFLGSLVQLVGGIVFFQGQGDGSEQNGFLMFLGASAVLTGGIYMAIGVIAEGLRLGYRWVAHDGSLHRQ